MFRPIFEIEGVGISLSSSRQISLRSGAWRFSTTNIKSRHWTRL